MKKIIIILAFIVASAGLLLSGCAPTQMIADKTGVQLWGENCNRCHNAPSMEQYNKDQWVVIGDHMRVRANVTNEEVTKIVGFLQGVSQ